MKKNSLYLFLFLSLGWLLSCQQQTPPAQEGMAYIPQGTFAMGGRSTQASQDEFPRHEVKVSAFFMDETEVTNQQFEAFVKATGYQTVAEQPIDWEKMKQDLPPGTPRPPDSVMQPGSLTFHPTQGAVNLNRFDLWWDWTIGANWLHPEGPGSDIVDRMDHPVIHIAWEDAAAYAAWADKRLPTEAEWEWAAVGGNNENKYPWGNTSIEEAHDKANFWQGNFPYQNTAEDGYISTSPVKTYPANGYGLYDMAGNAWEWCQDKYHVNTYKEAENAGKVINPQGPATSFDPNEPYVKNKYAIRGGSFLCNDSYCSGYRSSRRMASEGESGANHKGFRCVKDAE